MTTRESTAWIFGRTAITLVILWGAPVMAAEEELVLTSSMEISPSVLASAKKLKSEIRSINSALPDARKQRFTDVSAVVQKYIPTGSTFDDAATLLLAMGCKPPLRLGVGQSAPRDYRRPSCTAMVTLEPDRSRLLGALLELPGGLLYGGHWLSIDAQAGGTDDKITSVSATIDIRSLSNN